MINEKVFTLFWVGSSKSEIVTGVNIVKAFTKAGYGVGALSVLDTYIEGENNGQYIFNSETKEWKKR